jgi:hypothetical protein
MWYLSEAHETLDALIARCAKFVGRMLRPGLTGRVARAPMIAAYRLCWRAKGGVPER